MKKIIEKESALQKKELDRLRQQRAILKKFAADALGEGYWGLSSDREEKFTHEEILFLFSRIFLSIGFESIKIVRTNYPDIIAIKNGEEKGVELEPVLSLFKHHLGDDLSACDYIVCWENDLKRTDELKDILKENAIEVIELKKFYQLTKKKGHKKKTDLVHSEKDIQGLTDGQLKVLSVFIQNDASILSTKEIGKGLGNPGKIMGAWIGGLCSIAKKKEYLMRKTPKGYQFNEKYRDVIRTVLEEFDYI